MKKKIKHFLVFLGILVLISCRTTSSEDEKASLPELGTIEDGIYRGEYSFAKTPVKAIVDVNVQDHTISEITIVKHRCSPIGKKGEKIIQAVIEQQSLDVDAVSGATASSKTILMAIQNALLKGNRPEQ